MITITVFFFASLLLLVIMLQVRAYYILKRQNKVISEQSEKIHTQYEELTTQHNQLQTLNNEKQQIIGVVSHDLKGPFNRIFALVQLLNMSGHNLTTDQQEYAGKIQQVAVDGLNMVRNLLDTRKVEDHMIEMELDRLNLDSFLFSFIKNYRSIAAKKKINIALDCPADLHIIVDRSFLNRIMDNLLSNAVKFSEPNTTVHVTVENGDDEARLSVKDEGPGISEEDHKKLYQKFQRLSAKPTAGESSTGLGLFIVKTLIEKMGGTIQCKSRLGEGAVFTATFQKS